MESELISVVIPVYNAGQWMERCIFYRIATDHTMLAWEKNQKKAQREAKK